MGKHPVREGLEEDRNVDRAIFKDDDDEVVVGEKGDQVQVRFDTKSLFRKFLF